jgi:hypothetical protein
MFENLPRPWNENSIIYGQSTNLPFGLTKILIPKSLVRRDLVTNIKNITR